MQAENARQDVTAALCEFTTKVRYKDLPGEAIHEVKRLLLDSIGCALAGWSVDKGRCAAKLAEQIGGNPESTIIGGGRESSPTAAFVNGELINALDFDSTCTQGHIVPYVLPASLALAERCRASGQKLILALALAQEISTRTGRALSSLREWVRTEAGEMSYQPSPVYAYSSCTIGGTVGGSKILDFNLEKTSYAVGIAGCITPVPTMVKWLNTPISPMGKYSLAGWVSQAEVTAVLLAAAGYTGDATVLDGEHGFWRFFGSQKWEPHRIFDELGKVWHFPHSTNYKVFPCCGITHAGLECFVKIINQNELKPDEIEEVRVFMEAFRIHQPVWRNREIRTHVDAQFSIPYIYAVTAYRINPGVEWQETATMRNREIMSFMNRVKLFPLEEYGSIMSSAPSAKEHPSASQPAIIEVKSRGRTFREEGLFARGKYFPESARLTDGEIEGKFRMNAGKNLTEERMQKVIQAVYDLDRMKDVSQLMRLIAI